MLNFIILDFKYIFLKTVHPTPPSARDNSKLDNLI